MLLLFEVSPAWTAADIHPKSLMFGLRKSAEMRGGRFGSAWAPPGHVGPGPSRTPGGVKERPAFFSGFQAPSTLLGTQ